MDIVIVLLVGNVFRTMAVMCWALCEIQKENTKKKKGNSRPAQKPTK